MAEAPHPLRIFLCHSSDDKQAVRELYQRLRADGFDPWLDKENILPGQDWEQEITKAVGECDIVLVCLSGGSINKRGFVQKEIKYALDVADEQPSGTIYLIPLMLEECVTPEPLRRWQWVRLFEPNGYERLLNALEHRAKCVGAAIPPSSTRSTGGNKLLADGKQAIWDRLESKMRQRPEQSVSWMAGRSRWIVGIAFLLLIVSLYITLKLWKGNFTPSSSSLTQQSRLSTVTGLVADSTGGAVANMSVILTPEADKNGDKQVSALTDAKGNFHLRNVVPGHYRIEAHKMGYAGISRDNIVIHNNMNMFIPIQGNSIRVYIVYDNLFIQLD